MLDKRLSEKAYDRLVIVAPPKALGDLRAALSAHVRPLIYAELDKDLVKIPTGGAAEPPRRRHGDLSRGFGAITIAIPGRARSRRAVGGQGPVAGWHLSDCRNTVTFRAWCGEFSVNIDVSPRPSRCSASRSTRCFFPGISPLSSRRSCSRPNSASPPTPCAARTRTTAASPAHRRRAARSARGWRRSTSPSHRRRRPISRCRPLPPRRSRT